VPYFVWEFVMVTVAGLAYVAIAIIEIMSRAKKYGFQ